MNCQSSQPSGGKSHSTVTPAAATHRSASESAAASSLSDIIAKVKAAKKAIDEGDTNGAGPISWADTVYLAGKVAMQKQWDEIKVRL